VWVLTKLTERCSLCRCHALLVVYMPVVVPWFFSSNMHMHSSKTRHSNASQTSLVHQSRSLCTCTSPALAALAAIATSSTACSWDNRGYATFDDFLADLKQRKRKNIRQVRVCVCVDTLACICSAVLACCNPVASGCRQEAFVWGFVLAAF
jgi:hypothetical protein